MSALVDLDLNCRPPSPEPAVPEEPRWAMPRQEQPVPDQMKDLHNKLYGSFWKEYSDASSNLHSTLDHKLMSLGKSGNPNPHVSSNSNKRKTHAEVAEQNSDVRSSIRRKPHVGVLEKHAYHDVIDLEKPATSDDVADTCYGFGNLANHTGRSQDGSCCVLPESTSLAETVPPCREPNPSRVSPGSVGSSETPYCQSPIKQSNTESRHSHIDLNEPQEDSLHVFCVPSQRVYSPLLHSSSPYHGIFSKSSRQIFQEECGSSIGSLKESSIVVNAPSSAADSSRDMAAASSIQQKGLIDLNVTLQSIDTPSEIISNCRDKVVSNDGNKGTVSYHLYSKLNILQAETFRAHTVSENDDMLARKDDNNVLLMISTTSDISKAQSELLIPETPQVYSHAPPRLGVSHDGPSNSQVTVTMLQGESEGDDRAASTAAETLLSIFSDYSACAADFLGSNSNTSTRGGNDEPQCTLDSFEKIVLNLEEVKEDGQSILVLPPVKDVPACGIKLRRGRGMRNFQREIIPGLVSLTRQEICDDLHSIGYEPKKTRSRKASRGRGASSTRSRPRKRGSATRN